MASLYTLLDLPCLVAPRGDFDTRTLTTSKMRNGSTSLTSRLAAVVLLALLGKRLGGPLAGGVVAFQIPYVMRQHVSFSYTTMSTTPVFLSSSPKEETEEVEEATSSTSSDTVTSTAVQETNKEQEDDSPSYPLDVPSPILLASSMVIAIASTGSLFELLGGTPQLGFAPTAAIVVLGFPTTLFLFYASIKKAIAETEEDDKRFLSGR